jgi:hypothetical protein
MATVYFQRRPLIGTRGYWSFLKARNVKPSERGKLGLVLAEYNIVAGDISLNPNKKLAEYRRGLKKDGHKIVLVS